MTTTTKKNLLVKNYYNEGEDKKGGGRGVGGEGGYFRADKTVRKGNIYMDFWKNQSRWDNINKPEQRKHIHKKKKKTLKKNSYRRYGK